MSPMSLCGTVTGVLRHETGLRTGSRIPGGLDDGCEGCNGARPDRGSRACTVRACLPAFGDRRVQALEEGFRFHIVGDRDAQDLPGLVVENLVLVQVLLPLLLVVPMPLPVVFDSDLPLRISQVDVVHDPGGRVYELHVRHWLGVTASEDH